MKKIIPVLLCILLSACGEKETVNLGEGYRYFEVDGDNYVILDRDNFLVVDPNVTDYKVIGRYIVGAREKPSLIDDPRFSRHFGYFILDMQSGELVEGLDKVAFQEALRARSLPTKPF